uniref:C3H1-type domain-containing protein n=1 Tax=Onchocerca volvulus TaxID=6282 RepID=A0A8R1XZV0_ONCVO
MTTMFSHPEPDDTIVDHQLSEMPSLPSQAEPFLPTLSPAIPPPQGTVCFQPPYVFPDGLPQPVFCEQPNVPSLLENNSTEEAEPEVSSDAIYYPPLSIPIPFPPPVQPVPFFSPNISPIPVVFVLPPFPYISVPGNALPFSSYQNWLKTNATSHSPTIRKTPRKNYILSTGAHQSSLKFSGDDDCRNFQRDNANRSESMYQNTLNNYRTRLCINFKNGHCSYGEKCRFIHQQTSDGIMKTKFSANAPEFVPKVNAMHAKPNTPFTSLDLVPLNRLHNSMPVSLLTKSQNNNLDVKEWPITSTGRKVSCRHDFSLGYRRPSVIDGPHSLPGC